MFLGGEKFWYVADNNYGLKVEILDVFCPGCYKVVIFVLKGSEWERNCNGRLSNYGVGGSGKLDYGLTEGKDVYIFPTERKMVNHINNELKDLLKINRRHIKQLDKKENIKKLVDKI